MTLAFVASSNVPQNGREPAADIARRVFRDTKVPGVVLHDASKQADWTLALLDRVNSEIIGVHSVGTNVASCSLVVLVNDRATLGHVGNTRAYVFGITGDHTLWTTEHTLAATLSASGLRLPALPVAESTDSEELLRCLGGKSQIEKGYLQDLGSNQSNGERKRWIRLESGQSLVLCSGAPGLDFGVVAAHAVQCGIADDPKRLGAELVGRLARLDPSPPAATAIVTRPVAKT